MDDQHELVPAIHLTPLSERNAEAASVALTEIYTKLYEGLDKILAQQATLSDLVVRMGKVEALVNVKDMKLTGLGPSVVE